MNENKKIAFNSIIIFLRLCLVSFIGIYASRVVLDALGASDFGLYNVVGGIVIILNVINTAMVTTTYRYIAFELGKGEDGNPRKTFNIVFLIHACFALLILLLGFTVGDWYVNNFLNVAPDRIADALFVLHISIITTTLNTLLVPYQGLLVAFEKFSVSAIIDIVSNIMRLLAIVYFLYGTEDRLRFYSLIMLIYNMLHCIAFVLYCLLHYRKIIAFRIFKDMVMVKEMLSFSGWTLFGASASVAQMQGTAIVINFFFGTMVNAAYAVASQVNNFILLFSRSLNNAAIPQITKNFSGGNSQRSVMLTSYISKYSYILMCFVAFPVLLEMDFLLGIWLKKVPENTSLFCKLMVVNGLLSCLGAGIPALVQAIGKIKIFQLTISVLQLLGLPIAYLFFKWLFPAYYIMVIYAVLTITSALIQLYLLKKVLDFDIKNFFQVSYSRIFMMTVPLVLVYFIYNPKNFTISQHVFGLLVSILFLIVVVYTCGMESKERRIVKNAIIFVKKKYL